jgi:hypothetical protein
MPISLISVGVIKRYLECLYRQYMHIVGKHKIYLREI